MAPAKVWDLSSSDRDPEWREVLTAETTDVTFSREDVRFVEVGNTTYTLIGLTADTSRLYRTEDGIAWVTALEISTSARIRHVWTTNGVALWYDGRRSELSGGVVPGSVTASVLDSPDFPANSITAMQAHCDASR